MAALLRFSRREEFRLEPVDLGAPARAALEPLRPRLEDARIRVELDVPEGIVARADAEKMRHVIANLIENALDALHDAPDVRRLVIALRADDGMARLRVEDSGPGVPGDALPRLFEPFFRGKSTGAGLGLAIAKRTVDAHGGRISAASAPGSGLRIEVELPLTRSG